jgi:type II secretory pathway pseudopilin PulG
MAANRQRTAKRQVRRGQAGYTLVEVLIAAAIALFGFFALLNLQISSLHGIANARSMTVGVTMAEHFIELIKGRSIACAGDIGGAHCGFWPANNDITGTWTVWGTASDNQIAPYNIETADGDGDFDFGISQEFDPGVNRKYCVHWRTAWVTDGQTIRIDVRVLWPREDTPLDTFQSCGLNLVPVAGSGQPMMVGSVTLSRAVALGLL